jgi:hypothetical protein
LSGPGVAVENGSRNAVYLENLLHVRVADILAQRLGESSRVTAESAAHINGRIAGLTSSLTDASSKLVDANDQSSKLSRNLNVLTAAIAIAALLTAAATFFQGWETKRQADLLERQLQLELHPPPAASKSDR